MVALVVILILLTLLRGPMRRAGVAGWLALSGAFMTAFGDGQPRGDDWMAAVVVGVVVLAGARAAQSYSREAPRG